MVKMLPDCELQLRVEVVPKEKCGVAKGVRCLLLSQMRKVLAGKNEEIRIPAVGRTPSMRHEKRNP